MDTRLPSQFSTPSLLFALALTFYTAIPGELIAQQNSGDFVVVVGATPIPPTLDPSQPPGRNFDLSHWYLGLPDSGASSISHQDLMDGYTHPSWFYTGSDGSMVFFAPVNGGTTPNSP